MICRRCNLEGAIDLDTGGQYHAEPSECIARQKARIAKAACDLRHIEHISMERETRAVARAAFERLEGE